DVDPAALEVQRGATRPGAEVDRGAARDDRQELALPPCPLVEGPEEPLRVHRGNRLAGAGFERGRGHVTTDLVVAQRRSPRVSTRGDDAHDGACGRRARRLKLSGTRTAPAGGAHRPSDVRTSHGKRG